MHFIPISLLSLLLVTFLINRTGVKIVKLLIDNGADINIQNSCGNTPLHYAVFDGYTEIVKLLINNGANLNLHGSQGNTPLHIAAIVGLPEIVKLLINNGANLNLRAMEGVSPFYCAVEEGNFKVVRLLVNYCDDNNCYDSLHIANDDEVTPQELAERRANSAKRGLSDDDPWECENIADLLEAHAYVASTKIQKR